MSMRKHQESSKHICWWRVCRLFRLEALISVCASRYGIMLRAFLAFCHGSNGICRVLPFQDQAENVSRKRNGSKRGKLYMNNAYNHSGDVSAERMLLVSRCTLYPIALTSGTELTANDAAIEKLRTLLHQYGGRM